MPGPLLLLVLLDLTFNLYFWRIPKLTSAWTDYGYEFLRRVHFLEDAEPYGRLRVIAFGSSVVGSFDPKQVQGLVNAAEPSTLVDVHRLLVPGIKPTDLRVFFDAELEKSRPDIVVMVVNIADFLNSSFDRDLKEQVRYVLPPWRTLVERHRFLPLATKLDLLLGSASNFYRYRNVIRSAVQDHLKFVAHWLQRWLHRRTRRRSYGIYPDGYTAQYFGLPVYGRSTLDLQYYVHPDWIAQHGRVVLSFSLGDELLARRVETRPGWKSIHLRFSRQRAHLLQVVCDSIWNPRAAGLDEDVRPLGVRLRQMPPGTEVDGDLRPPLTYPPLFLHHTLLRLGDAVGEAYLDRWKSEVSGNSAFGRRLRAYEREELSVCRQPFRPTEEYVGLAQMVANFVRHGVRVVLINSPESPLLLSRYEDTPYYRGHVGFLSGLAKRYRGVYFHNLAAALPAEDFNDWHHVNYIGAIKLGERYAGFVRQAMPEPRASVASAQERR